MRLFAILNELKENRIDINMLDAKSAELYYSPFKQLEISALGSARFVKTTQEVKLLEHSNRAMAYRAIDNSDVVKNNNYLYKDPDKVNATPQVVLPQGGFMTRRTTSSPTTTYGLPLTITITLTTTI